MKTYDIDALTTEAVELLKRLISVPAYSGKEEVAAKLLMNELDRYGIRYLQKGNNIWTYSSKSDKPKVLLNSHLDTVFPCSGWDHSPFSAHEKNTKIYGLGANDAGASLVSLFVTYKVLKDLELPYDLIFSATAEEEITGAMGMESVLPLIGAFDLAIIGEPTSMKLALGERGLMVLDIKTKGEVSHVAHFNGKNAIDLAFEDYSKIKKIDFQDDQSVLGRTKFSLTQIIAGKQHNVTPAECSMVVDVRTNEIISNTEVLEAVKKELKSKVTARSTRLNASFIESENPVVTAAKEMGIECITSNTISDQAVIPYPSVKIGPGDSKRSHTPNEFICIEEIKEGITTYIELLTKLHF